MVRPLTKRTKKGVLYTRPPRCRNRDQGGATGRSGRRCVGASRSRIDRSPEHLGSECLVHLLRDAHRKEDDRRMGTDTTGPARSL